MAIIPKPNKATYVEALTYAEQVRQSDNDPYSLAHTLLYLAERNTHLESIYKAVEAYIRFGQDPQLHANLIKALEKFDDYEVEAETMEDPKLGLN